MLRCVLPRSSRASNRPGRPRRIQARELAPSAQDSQGRGAGTPSGLRRPCLSRTTAGRMSCSWTCMARDATPSRRDCCAGYETKSASLRAIRLRNSRLKNSPQAFTYPHHPRLPTNSPHQVANLFLTAAGVDIGPARGCFSGSWCSPPDLRRRCPPKPRRSRLSSAQPCDTRQQRLH
jgi:hypothetical protein